MITELHITYDDQTGAVNVNGPIGNKGLCYLMLECARDAVKDHVDRNVPIAVPLGGKVEEIIRNGLGLGRRGNKPRRK
jgi:hypothetical protein